MDIEQGLLREHSKELTLKIAAWIGGDAKRFAQLMELLLNGEPLVAQRAAWVLGIVGEEHPALMLPYVKKMIARLKQPGVHDAVKRNFLRILQFMDLPRGLLGTVTSLCFDLLSSAKEPIAVKVFSMTVLARIARLEPDLEKELRLVVQQQMPLAGGAFRARAKNVLRMVPEEY